jgi:cell division transport system permease protein
LKEETAVEEVVFQKNIVETLSAWTRGLRNIGGGVVVFLLATSLLTTLIVVGLNISLHKEEIEIMRLVGATSGYIRTPFIFEGIFYGAVSGILATVALWGIFTWFSPTLQRIFSGVSLLPVSSATFAYLLLFEIVAGVAIGIIGSFVATRKYLTA